MFITPVHTASNLEPEVWERLPREWETHGEGLFDKPECPVDICGLEFKVKPMSLIAEMSLEKFSCRGQVWRRRWVDLNRSRVSRVSATKGDTAGDLRLFEMQVF